MLFEAAIGRFPPSDGGVEVLPAVDGLAAIVVAFSGHNVIATGLEPSEVVAHLPSRDPGAAMNPAFLAWLGERLDAITYTPDLVLAAFGCDRDPSFSLVERDDLREHPRVRLASRIRRDVRVFSDRDDKGLVTIARSPVCDRWEMSLEVAPAVRGAGLGRKLALAARSLVEADEPLFACA
jgi:hypothetical protein